MAERRASFGSTRKLPSGQWQARYPDEAGRRMNAPRTFATKRAALAHLAEVQADRHRGSYIDHRDSARTFGDYARAWIDGGGSRGRLAPRTAALYWDLLRGPLGHFDPVPLGAISGEGVRAWYASTRRSLAKAAKRRGGTGETRLRQSYALLRAVLATAVADRLIAANPCRIVSAGVASSPERPHLSPEVLAAIVERMPAHYEMPMQIMFAAHLRLGELLGLERGDFARPGTLRVERQVQRIAGERVIVPTKTGTARTVALPPSATALLEAHLASPGFPRSPMFLRPDGTPLAAHALQQAWAKAARAAGHEGFHLHDVRHAGLTLAAQAGATTRELMARGGHSTSRAAMLYQHAAEERSAIVAKAMDDVLQAARGTQRARETGSGAISALPS